MLLPHSKSFNIFGNKGIGFIKILAVLFLGLTLHACGGEESGSSGSSDSSTPPNTNLNQVRSNVLTGSTLDGVVFGLLDASGQLIALEPTALSNQQLVLDFTQAPLDGVTFPVLLFTDTLPPLSTILFSPSLSTNAVSNLNPITHETTLRVLPETLLNQAVEQLPTASAQSSVSVDLGTFDFSQVTTLEFTSQGNLLMNQLNNADIAFEQLWSADFDNTTDLPGLFLQTLLHWKSISSLANAFRINRPTLTLPSAAETDLRWNLLDRADFQIRLGGQMILEGLDTTQVQVAVGSLAETQAQKLAAVAEALRASQKQTEDEHVFVILSGTEGVTDLEDLEVELFINTITNSFGIAVALLDQLGTPSTSVATALGRALNANRSALQSTRVSTTTLESILTQTNANTPISLDGISVEALNASFLAITTSLQAGANSGVDLTQETSTDTTTTTTTTTTSSPSTTLVDCDALPFPPPRGCF